MCSSSLRCSAEAARYASPLPALRGEGCVGLKRPMQQARRARVRGLGRESLILRCPLTPAPLTLRWLRTRHGVRSPLPARRGEVFALILAGLIAFGSTAHARELRVCADPNNLPFSNERGEGFENKIVALLAR